MIEATNGNGLFKWSKDMYMYRETCYKTIEKPSGFMEFDHVTNRVFIFR
jgi:hypothetical protein